MWTEVYTKNHYYIRKRAIMNWDESIAWLKRQPEYKELIYYCYYDDPIDDALIRFRNSTEWKATTPYLPSPGTALDIGAGNGIASCAFAELGWRVFSLEPNIGSIAGLKSFMPVAKRKKYPIFPICGYAEQLPFGDSYFDLVYMRQVMHHAQDLSQFCAEVFRVLKPGGTVIAVRDHVITKHDDLILFKESHPLAGICGEEHAYLCNDYLYALKSAGFQVSNVLNPKESDINLYPSNCNEYKRKIREKIHLPDIFPIPNICLKIMGSLDNTPGRLYSFVGHKKNS